MSDIFIKTAAAGSPGWKRMTALFVKTAAQGLSGWKSALGVWLRRTDSWVRVWPLSGVFSTRTSWIGPDSTTAYADRLASSSAIRIGSNYYGNNAQWDANGWTITSYSYAWKYYSTNDGTSTGTTFPGESGTGSGWTAGGTGQDILPLATWDNATNNTTYDRKYLRFEVTANATNSTYSGFDTSPYIQIVRRVPINITTSLTDYTPEVGTAITYSSTWDTTEARKAESARTTIQWYSNASNSTTGGTAISGATSASYTPVAADVGKYLYVVETRFNSGTDYDYQSTSIGVQATAITTGTVTNISFQNTGSQRRITLPSNFIEGTTIYISTNGYITWGGSDPGTAIALPSSGTTLAILAADLRQGAPTSNGSNTSAGGLWVYADATNYYVRWEGNYYNDSSQLAEYQVKFYWNQSYADVYFITNSITTTTPDTIAVKSGSTTFRTWGDSTAQSSTLLSTASMIKITDQDGVDDNRTLTTAGQYPSSPGTFQNYSFTTGNSHLFLTTGSSNTSVVYKYVTTLTGSSFSTSNITRSVSANTAYQFIDNVISSFTLRTWNADTYSAATTYTRNSLVWYAGNQYRGKDVGFSNFLPTNTTYWTLSSTRAPQWNSSTTYSSNTEVWYNGNIYVSGLGSTNVTPTTGGDYWYFVETYSNTYNSSTTYLTGNTARYNGSTYTAKSLTWSSFVPTNTTYWSVETTVTYNEGDYVFFSNEYYFARSSFNGKYPTDTGFWFADYYPLQVSITPYNGFFYGATINSGTTVFIRPDVRSETVAISAGPTFSSITGSSITATYTTSVYTNRVVIDIQKGSPLTSISGYPYTKTTSGATQYTEVPTGLSSGTSHTFSFTPRYLYTGNVYYEGTTATGTESTASLYTVTFNANGGSGAANPTSVTQSTVGGSVTTAAQGTLSLSGYTFRGWNTNTSGTGTDIAASTSYTPTANITLYAKWQRSLTYDKNTTDSVTGMPDPLTSYHNNNATPTVASGPSRTNFTFNGWNTAANGSGTSYAAGTTITMNANYTLYAQWTPITYTVTWNANGGSVSPTSSSVNAGTSVTAPTPTRSGYTFNGWYSASSGGSLIVNAGNSYTPSSSVTLYAQWTVIQYTVTFNANGGSVSPTSSTVNAGSSVTLPTPSRDQYTFNGWYTSSSGGSFVGNAGSSYTPSSSITIYAQWTAIIYTITWNPSGGSPTNTSTGINGASVTSPTQGTGANQVDRSGFTLLYWRETPSGDFLYTINPGGSWTIDGMNRTFYARWQSNFVTPTAPAPSLNTQRLTASQFLRWYCDYPSVSGDVQSITGMAFEIRTTAGGGTLLASNTRSYPGDFTYPYNVGGVGWAFKCGVDGQVSDISYSSSTRYARVRVVMAGTDGNTYYGTWTGWTSL